VNQAAELLLDILLVAGVPEVVLLHPDRVENDLVLSRLDVAGAQRLHLVERLVKQLHLYVLPGAVEVLLDLLLGLKPVAVLSTKINA
jgi:hypothetical protein